MYCWRRHLRSQVHSGPSAPRLNMPTSQMRQMPADFLRSVAAWLDGVCILRLWQCGDSMLSAQLFSADTVSSFCVTPRWAPPTIEWPKIVSRLQHLRALRWNSHFSHNTPFITGLGPHGLSSKLRVIELDAQNAPQLFSSATDPTLLADNLSSLFPFFTDLTLRGSTANSWVGGNMDALPQTLRFLCLDELFVAPNFSIRLPNLETLRVLQQCDIAGPAFLELPPSLKSLLVPGLKKVLSSEISNLPRNLEHFEAFGTADPSSTETSALVFPPLLQTLSLQSCTFNNDLVMSLPSGLKKLVCRSGRAISSSCIPLLPSGLTHLEFPHMTHVKIDTMRSLPASLIHLDLISVEMEVAFSALLPRSLQALLVSGSQDLSEEFLVELPPNLKVLEVRNWHNFSDNMAPLLPSHLTKLSIGSSLNTTDELVRLLPRTITDLETGARTEWTCKFTQLLPPSLKYLYAPLLQTATNESVAHFPTTLKSLVMPSAKLLTQECVPLLPSSLTNLILCSPLIAMDYERLHRRSTNGRTQF